MWQLVADQRKYSATTVEDSSVYICLAGNILQKKRLLQCYSFSVAAVRFCAANTNMTHSLALLPFSFVYFFYFFEMQWQWLALCGSPQMLMSLYELLVCNMKYYYIKRTKHRLE